MFNYLSLNRKNPVIDEHSIPNRTQPVQFALELSATSNTSIEKFSKVIAIISVEIQPTPTVTNHFCLSFKEGFVSFFLGCGSFILLYDGLSIMKYNTFLCYVIVTQQL